MKVFIDTNVLLDVLAKREPFLADSATIWTLAETGKIEGLVSAISFTNIYYVVRKLADAKTADRTLVLLRNSFHAVACDHQVINQAIDSKSKDFEDAVQYFSALHAHADCIVSRNPDHFPRTPHCPVITPAEFLATYSFE
jgi:predicted nucleic acid-binding protein